MNLADLADAVPRWPHGHINNTVAPGLRHYLRHPCETLADVNTLNGFISRAFYLIDNPPPPVLLPPPDGGGTPAGQGRLTFEECLERSCA